MEKKINKIVEQKKEIFAILASNECASSFENEIRIPEGYSMECALRYLRQQVNPVEARTFMADNFFNLYELYILLHLNMFLYRFAKHKAH